MLDSRLPKLSEVLSNIEEPQAKRTVIRLFGDYVRTLRTFNSRLRSVRDQEIIDDYNQVKSICKMTKTTNEDGDGTSTTNEGELATQARQEANESILKALQPYLPSMNRINLNELVIKPDSFDGYLPKPRDWIDCYEEAFMANDWSEATALKYFPTFLRGAALDWFKAMVRPKMSSIDSWQQLRSIFSRHYLGKDELKIRRQEFSALNQGQREPALNFIPKAYKLLKQIYPKLDEEEAIDRITSKLRADVIRSLPLEPAETIEDLVAMACKVESRQRQIDQKMKTKNDERPMYRQPQQAVRTSTNQEAPKQQATGVGQPKYTRQSETTTAGGSGASKSSIQCYRCKDRGHIGKDCTATKAIDGKPLRLPKNLQPNSSRVNTVQEPKLVLNSGVQFKDTVNSVKPGNGVSNPMLFQLLKCNGVKVSGLVDTGSFHTILDAAFVRNHEWKIDLPAPVLGAAGNNPLRCIGTCKVSVEMTLNKRTRSATFHFAVVENLGLNLLIGLEFVSIMQLMIDAGNRQLFFKRSSVPKKPRGICAKEDLVIAPRTQEVVEASVQATGTVLAIPNTFDNGLLVGNSVSRVESGTVRMILVNTSKAAVKIKSRTQLAAFETMDEEDTTNNVNRVIELAGFDDTVCVGDDLNDDQISDLSELLVNNKNAFSQGGRIGELKDERFFHKIELLPDSQPFNEQLRRRPKVHVDETRRQVKALLEAGIIEESESPFASAYLLVRKKSGEYRLCIDFRRLNSMTKKLVYPLPNIEECVDTLAGKNFFSLLDFSMGFHQLPMAKESRELTAFKTEDGLFHYRRMPFGLANAPSSFQRMINATLLGLRGVNLQIFIDDVCIGSDTWPEHMQMLEKVLKIVSKSNLTLKGSKCVFGAKKVLFLGHIISGEGVRQDPAKTKALLKMPEPNDVPGVRRALGMLGYYRKFIPNFAAISEPLTKLLKKKIVFKWTETEKVALQTLLSGLAKDVLLNNFNHSDPIAVKTDACKAGVAAMLLQLQRGEWRLIVCCSRRLNEHEVNYGISELECLAIVYAVEKLRSYLLGKRFQVLTDHSALSVLESKQPNSSRLRRWALVLQEFDFSIVYTKGQLQADVDCLSRAPIDPPDDAVERRIFHIVAPICPADWNKNYDDDASKLFLQYAQANERKFSLKNGAIYHDKALYVPPNMVAKLIRETHEGPIACHGGVAVTTAAIEYYWWPSKTEDIKAFVASCQACQARKVERVKPAGTMHSFEVFAANELVAIDYLGKLTETIARNLHVILAIDCFTRYVFARAVPDTSTDGYIDFLLDYVGAFGIPKRVLTDGAMNFSSKRAKEVEKVLGITHVFSTPTHSQGNALAERALQSLQEKINLVVKQHNLTEANWDSVLQLAVLALNTSVHKSTKYSPFELKFGEKHRLISSASETKPRTSLDVHVRDLQTQLENVRTVARSTQHKSQSAAKERYDEHHRQISFEVGELVRVRAKERNSKLADRFDRVCKIVSQSQDIYQLVDIKTNQKLSRHISKLKKFVPPQDTVHLVTTTMVQPAWHHVVAITVWVTLVSQAIGEVSFQTPRESFVIWKEDRKHVPKPKREYEINIAFIDPCKIIHNDFPGFWAATSEEYDPVYYAYHGCNENYKKNILVPMDSLVDRYNSRIRKRRSPALIGLVGGIWLSNVLDSYFNDNDAIASHEAQQDEALQTLNRQQNYSTQTVVELARSQNIMTDKINELYNEIETTKRDFIKLQFALNWVNIHFTRKRSAIEQLRFDLINGKQLNLHALNVLLDTHIFENIDSANLEFISIVKSKDEKYSIRFYAHEIDEDMKLYNVATFTHWINVTDSPATLVAYNGPPMTLVNTQNGCVVGIHDKHPESITQGCRTKNGRSLELDSWRSVRFGNPFSDPTPTAYIERLPDYIVYCFGRAISIADEPSIDCPPYPIAIPATISWKTNDKVFHGLEKISMNFSTVPSFPPGIVPSHIMDPNAKKFTETDALKKIYNLTSLLVSAQQDSLILNTPVGGVSYSVWNKIVLLSVVCLMIWAVYLWRHQHTTLDNHHNRIVDLFHKYRGSGPYPDLPDIEKDIEDKQNIILSFINKQKANLTAKPE